MKQPDIRNFTRQELAGAIVALGEKATKVDRVFNCLHKKGVATFEAMSGVQAELIKKLAGKYSITAFPKIEKLVSKIDGTIKLLLTFPDCAIVESVILFNKNTVTACISSQAGCACGCTFCATGALGLKRELKPSEILAQFVACRREAGKPIDNVVFMGMGEPFLNWANVKKSIMILSDNKGHNFPQSSITVSTVGVVPVIRELADSHMGVRLAISLITPDEAQRAELTPMNNKYGLREIIGAARYYGDRTKKSVFFEYILFDGLNDSPEYAHKLLALIKDLNCKINLIRYNPGSLATAYTPTNVEKAKEFQKILVEAGFRTHLRREKGTDIAAACGQLAGGAVPKAA